MKFGSLGFVISDVSIPVYAVASMKKTSMQVIVNVLLWGGGDTGESIKIDLWGHSHMMCPLSGDTPKAIVSDFWGIFLN